VGHLGGIRGAKTGYIAHSVPVYLNILAVCSSVAWLLISMLAQTTLVHIDETIRSNQNWERVQCPTHHALIEHGHGQLERVVVHVPRPQHRVPHPHRRVRPPGPSNRTLLSLTSAPSIETFEGYYTWGQGQNISR
jgi:hypothetical protein